MHLNKVHYTYNAFLAHLENGNRAKSATPSNRLSLLKINQVQNCDIVKFCVALQVWTQYFLSSTQESIYKKLVLSEYILSLIQLFI